MVRSRILPIFRYSSGGACVSSEIGWGSGSGSSEVGSGGSGACSGSGGWSAEVWLVS